MTSLNRLIDLRLTQQKLLDLEIDHRRITKTKKMSQKKRIMRMMRQSQKIKKSHHLQIQRRIRYNLSRELKRTDWNHQSDQAIPRNRKMNNTKMNLTIKTRKVAMIILLRVLPNNILRSKMKNYHLILTVHPQTHRTRLTNNLKMMPFLKSIRMS